MEDTQFSRSALAFKNNTGTEIKMRRFLGSINSAGDHLKNGLLCWLAETEILRFVVRYNVHGTKTFHDTAMLQGIYNGWFSFPWETGTKSLGMKYLQYSFIITWLTSPLSFLRAGVGPKSRRQTKRRAVLRYLWLVSPRRSSHHECSVWREDSVTKIII